MKDKELWCLVWCLQLQPAREMRNYINRASKIFELSLGEKCARITEQTSFFAVKSWLLGAPFLLGPSHFTFCLARDVRKGCTLSPSIAEAFFTLKNSSTGTGGGERRETMSHPCFYALSDDII